MNLAVEMRWDSMCVVRAMSRVMRLPSANAALGSNPTSAVYLLTEPVPVSPRMALMTNGTSLIADEVQWGK